MCLCLCLCLCLLQCVAVCCSVLQCVAVRSIVLRCAAMLELQTFTESRVDRKEYVCLCLCLCLCPLQYTALCCSARGADFVLGNSCFFEAITSPKRMAEKEERTSKRFQSTQNTPTSKLGRCRIEDVCLKAKCTLNLQKKFLMLIYNLTDLCVILN